MPVDIFLPPDLPTDRVAARIGLLSDTHLPERCAALPDGLFAALGGVDLLLHAGDLGELWVLDQLSAIAPVLAVHGNDDTPDAQRELPYQLLLTVANQRILLSHCHYPDRVQELESRRDDAWGPKLDRRAQLGRNAGASIVVFGHTHIPLALPWGDRLLVNPGALASPNYTTRQHVRTVARLYLRDDGVPFVVHIDLAAPERPYVPPLDLQAGFRYALDYFSATILAPELAARWHRLPAPSWSAPDPYREALLRAARVCWSNHSALLTPALLLAELHAQDDLPPETLAVCEAVLLAG